FLIKDTKFQGKRADQLSANVNGTTAHTGDDAGVLDIRPFQLDQNDRLLGPDQIGQYPENDKVEFLNLVPSKDRVRFTDHSGLDLIERHGLGQIGGRKSNGGQCKNDGQGEEPTYGGL